MGAHVHRHRLIGNEQLFRDHQAHWDGHRDALFISSIELHLTGNLRDGPCPWHGAVRIAHGLSSHDLPSTTFFLVHRPIRLRHQFTERNGALGIKPRHPNTE
jgi:hypothetical protein